jgi:hypothetical protein
MGDYDNGLKVTAKILVRGAGGGSESERFAGAGVGWFEDMAINQGMWAASRY